MLIEHLSKEFVKLVGMVEEGKAPFDQHQALILDFYRQRIETIEQTIEKLKENQLAIKNGNHKQKDKIMIVSMFVLLLFVNGDIKEFMGHHENDKGQWVEMGMSGCLSMRRTLKRNGW